MDSIKDYGAVGDGVTDDTAAIQRALDDERIGPDGQPTQDLPDQYNGRPKALFFPAGTYLVSDTLSWVGCCVTLQGQGSQTTVFRLAPGAPGFGDPAAPKPVIKTENGNMSFRQNLFDLAVHVGPGNAGAVGVDYIANNAGAMRNVEVVSEDGAGVTGIDETREWAGPSMMRDVLVQGFDVGVHVQHIEYGQTYVGLELRGQREAGFLNDGAVVSFENLVSDNQVPAIRARVDGLVTVLGAQLTGGAGGAGAIEIDSAKATDLYARDVTSEGYDAAVTDATVPVAGGTAAVDEWYSGSVSGAFPVTDGQLSLGLDVGATPPTVDLAADAAAVTCSGYAPDCPVVQQLADQLASGASTVYFPFGVRQVYDRLTVEVPPGVRRIVGYSSVINGGGPDGGGIRFVVADDSTEPLVIEQFGYGVSVEHSGSRPVVLKHGFYPYVSKPGAGDLYVEDAGIDGFQVQPGQRVWARQLNNEYRDGTKIVNGGDLWILGMKVEKATTVIETTPGGRTEYLGGLVYPAESAEPGDVVFEQRDAQATYLYSSAIYGTRNYDIQLRDTRGGETRDLTTAELELRTRFVAGVG